MGHATVAMTFDHYGYLFEAREADTAAMAEITARLKAYATGVRGISKGKDSFSLDHQLREFC
jgi:hypothetical protein